MKKVFILFILCSLFNFHASLYADDIYLKDGKIKNNIKVTRETYQKVFYKGEKDDKELNLPTSSIASVEYADTPESFLQGKGAAIAGEFELAIQFFKESSQIDTESDWIKQYAPFHIALCYQKWAQISSESSEKYNEAISFYNQALESKEDTRFLYEIHLGLAISLAGIKKYEQSLEKLESLEGYAKDNKEWAFEAILWQGNILLMQENYDKAIEKFKAAQEYGKKNDNKEQQNKGALAIGNSLIKQKAFPAANSHFQELKKKAGENDWNLLAGVENGLASIDLEEKAEEKLWNARRRLVKTLIEFHLAEQEKPKTLFLLAQCYEKMFSKEKSEKGSNERAKFYYQFLKDNYPNSEWTPRAIQRLNELTQE